MPDDMKLAVSIVLLIVNGAALNHFMSRNDAKWTLLTVSTLALIAYGAAHDLLVVIHG